MSGTKNNKKRILFLSLLLVALIAVFAIVYAQTIEKPSEGAKAITFSIVHGDGSIRQLTLHTDAELLRGALEEENLIVGTEGQYGLYIQTADGETADEAKQQWWCLTKNGEQVNTGADATPIADGEAYELTLKTGW